MDEINTRIHPRHLLEKSPSEINPRYRNCVFCLKLVSGLSDSYYCGICEFIFHKECATTLMLSNMKIYYPKIHAHTLHFIRQRNPFTCDACGGFDACGQNDRRIMNMYGCLPCDFFVHKRCIFLPRVIKITRHSHRLFHTFCIPPNEAMSCGVCHHNLKVGYGGYICKACDYVCHSYCATASKVWDGKDVEGQPERESEPEADLASLVEIESGKMRHFSHDHDLTTLNANVEEESGKLCQACILPIDFGNFFGCMQCEYALHDTCARLPRKMEHSIHRHPLTLHAENDTKEGFFTCSTCNRGSCGFMYECCRKECGFRTDIKCASFVDPFKHSAYPDPLFLIQVRDDRPPLECLACKNKSRTVATMETTVYGRFISLIFDLKCATLPRFARYKYDTHPLTLYAVYKDVFWCEICEEEIQFNRLNGYCHFVYTCAKCCTTVHVDCILGKHPYMKPGRKIQVNGLEIQIASNNGVSRRNCHTCHSTCQDKVVFINMENSISFCSIKCINPVKTIG